MNGYSFLALKSWIDALYAGAPVWVTPYGYTVTFLALAQNASATQQIQISANGDFVLTGLKHRAQIGTAQTIGNKTAPFVRLLIVDSGSNEQFTAQAVDLENYSQNGVSPNALPYPRFINGRGSLSVQATNYAPTVETYTSIDVFLEGVLVRKFSQPNVAP